MAVLVSYEKLDHCVRSKHIFHTIKIFLILLNPISATHYLGAVGENIFDLGPVLPPSSDGTPFLPSFVNTLIYNNLYYSGFRKQNWDFLPKPSHTNLCTSLPAGRGSIPIVPEFFQRKKLMLLGLTASHCLDSGRCQRLNSHSNPSNTG